MYKGGGKRERKSKWKAGIYNGGVRERQEK
jgi:hypothetical protein